METYRYNTLRFFRVQFGLPARMPLEWCVVRETSRAGSELRLGVALKGTGLYIDVAMRRFFSQVDIPLIERRCYPAERISRGNDYGIPERRRVELHLPQALHLRYLLPRAIQPRPADA